jgi:DNA topoisomerase IB
MPPSAAPTAAARYNALPARERIALYGKHLFEITAASAAASGPCAFVRLSSLDWTPCASLERALELHQGYLDSWRDEGRHDRELASSTGYVADQAHNITHWISPNGQIHAITYLGTSATLGGRSSALATMPLSTVACSLANDEADCGQRYFSGQSDTWLENQTRAQQPADQPRDRERPR